MFIATEDDEIVLQPGASVRESSLERKRMGAAWAAQYVPDLEEGERILPGHRGEWVEGRHWKGAGARSLPDWQVSERRGSPFLQLRKRSCFGEHAWR